VKSPLEIDYDVTVPPDAVHGDWVNIALEADGSLLGRARLQLFRPVSLRMLDAMQIHFGSDTELTPDPPVLMVEPKAGTNLEIAIRNNYPGIQTYRLEPAGGGLEFFPEKIEVSIAGTDERRVSLRVFATQGVSGVRDWRLRVSGGAALELPMRAVLLPRGRTIVWSADLDGDGSPEWVLENQKIRAVFTSQDGGRWIELNWKESNASLLPEHGALAAAGAVEVRGVGDALEFVAKGWRRTVRLVDHTLTMEQNIPLPGDGLSPVTRASASLSIDRISPNRVVYTVN